ncbi:hypothetical protein SUNI508_09482 [Seiridium unicorne]|uniref:Uncharacterized protein n=1 Tax=Seiridium unicorne TaxID=138068 RepID=A0ABR2UQL0_9PEZI
MAESPAAPGDDQFVAGMKKQVCDLLDALKWQCSMGLTQHPLPTLVEQIAKAQARTDRVLHLLVQDGPSPEMNIFKKDIEEAIDIALASFNTQLKLGLGNATTRLSGPSDIRDRPAAKLITPTSEQSSGYHGSTSDSSDISPLPQTPQSETPLPNADQSDASFLPSDSDLRNEDPESSDASIDNKRTRDSSPDEQPLASSERAPKRPRGATRPRAELQELGREDVGEEEYVFEVPYKGGDIYVTRCPACPDRRFRMHPLLNFSSMEMHWRGIKHSEKVQILTAAYVVEHCLLKGMVCQMLLSQGDWNADNSLVAGVGVQWANVHNVKADRKSHAILCHNFKVSNWSGVVPKARREAMKNNFGGVTPSRGPPAIHPCEALNPTAKLPHSHGSNQSPPRQTPFSHDSTINAPKIDEGSPRSIDCTVPYLPRPFTELVNNEQLPSTFAPMRRKHESFATPYQSHMSSTFVPSQSFTAPYPYMTSYDLGGQGYQAHTFETFHRNDHDPPPTCRPRQGIASQPIVISDDDTETDPRNPMVLDGDHVKIERFEEED